MQGSREPLTQFPCSMHVSLGEQLWLLLVWWLAEKENVELSLSLSLAFPVLTLAS